LHSHAYEDKAFPIGEGQTISQPYTVAFQTELLQVQVGDKVLEIGTGSGYQAAILYLLGANVHSIEYNRNLHLKAKQFLPKLGIKIKFYLGDGSKGRSEEHTSELQSRENLVCRLLLEKKNNTTD